MVAPVPCYRGYPDYAAAFGLQFVGIDALRDDDRTFVRKMTTGIEKNAPCLVALAHPDGINGRSFGLAVLKEIAAACAARDALLIIDEAYAGFMTPQRESTLLRFRNAVTLRTFSKTYGAAGVRLAGIVASPPIAVQIAKTRVANGLSSFAVGYLYFVMRNAVGFRRIAQDLMTWRAGIEAEFRRRRPDWLVPTSHANFVFADVGSELARDALRDRLVQARVHAKFFPEQPAFAHCVRLTVASPKIFAPVWDCIGGAHA
jgi:histidinol-phosphate aminotransferase